MEARYSVVQLDAHDTQLLIQEYNNLINTCPNYKNLTLQEFMECRNHIYVVSDVEHTFGIHHHDSIGIIGTKPCTMEDIGVKDLDFMCKEDHRMYSIVFFHYTLFGQTINYLGEYVSPTMCCVKLLREALVDKNDGFIGLRMYCPTGKTSEIHDALYISGFRIQEFNPKDSTYLYVRMPQMNLHRIGVDIIDQEMIDKDKENWGIKNSINNYKTKEILK